MMMRWMEHSRSLLRKGRNIVSKKVSLDNFADELVGILQEYTSEVEEELEKAKEENAKDGAKKLRVTSPKKTGKYAKGWRARKIGGAWVVHNATDYQLTHLLEKGHAKVGGGRVPGRPHIAPVEEDIITSFEKQLEKIIRDG